VVADPHCEEKVKPGIEEYGTGIDKLRLCFHAMEQMPKDEQPDFVLLAGDIHPWLLKDHVDDMTFPVHAIAGNHESTKERRNFMREIWPGDFMRDGKPTDYYSFVHNSVRFIGVCDAGCGGEHIGQFCSEAIVPRGQCEWLESELAKPEPRKIVFAHIPPQPGGADREMHINRNDSRWFNELVRKAKPEAMFFGHLHQLTKEYKIGATRCFNVRSCCWNFNNQPIGFLHIAMTQHGMTVREIETGKYSGV